ncbi:MAG: hypothetical protein M5U32_16640 [Myxococcota bacterium]|nr:hypothetical protein [Myxococcota bacterium]
MALLGSHSILKGDVIARGAAQDEAAGRRCLRDEEEGEQKGSKRRAMDPVSHGYRPHHRTPQEDIKGAYRPSDDLA